MRYPQVGGGTASNLVLPHHPLSAWRPERAWLAACGVSAHRDPSECLQGSVSCTRRECAMQQAIYPVQFSVDYPDRPLDRLTTFFRLVMAIPILIVLASVAGGTWQWSTRNTTTVVAAGAGGLLFFAPLLMIVFRRKYPRWWFDWNRELLRFSNRVSAYLALMDDHYPATDEQQAVHLEYLYPD